MGGLYTVQDNHIWDLSNRGKKDQKVAKKDHLGNISMMGLCGKKHLKTKKLCFGNSPCVPFLKEIDFPKFGRAVAKSKFQEHQIFLKIFGKGVPRGPKSDFVARIKLDIIL